MQLQIALELMNFYWQEGNGIAEDIHVHDFKKYYFHQTYNPG